MKKTNIVELLKDCPKGMELDCAMYDNLVFCEIDSEAQDYPIITQLPNGVQKWFTSDGRYELNPNAKCIIFPKGKTTWEGFQGPFVDGDIVALDSAGGSQVFIFEEYIRGEKDYAHCYLMLDDDGAVDLERGEYYVERFATEEEKQKLFQAIKDNGYKWDAETKTLEKLDEPKFKVGDKVLWNYNTEIPRVISKVELTSTRGYVYWIDCDGCSSGWWSENELTPIPNKFDITTLKPFDKVDTYKQALLTFGCHHQRMMCMEECGELIDALAKYDRGRNDSADVITELADVSIMVEQMAEFFGRVAYEAERERRMARLQELIEREKK